MSNVEDLQLQLVQKEEIIYRLQKKLKETEDENRKLNKQIEKWNKKYKGVTSKAKPPTWRHMRDFDDQVNKYEESVARDDLVQDHEERPKPKRSDNLLKNYFEEIKGKEERLRERLMEIQGEKTRLKCHYTYDIHDVDLVLHQKSREIQNLIGKLHVKNSRINEKLGKLEHDFH